MMKSSLSKHKEFILLIAFKKVFYSHKILPRKDLINSRAEYKPGGLYETIGLSDAWTDINALVYNCPERVKHPSQKPLRLCERIIKIFSKEGKVFIPFAGSGSEIIACLTLNRSWIKINELTKEDKVATLKDNELVYDCPINIELSTMGRFIPSSEEEKYRDYCKCGDTFCKLSEGGKCI